MSEGSLHHFLTRFQSIIFDLDGVIINSMDLKVACMKRALSSFDPHLVETYLAEFVQNFGRSRQYHFERFYRHYLGVADDSVPHPDLESFSSFYETYAGLYAAYLQAEYAQAPLCAHAQDVIAFLASQENISLFVATGTAESEAQMVLKEKGLYDYFQGVFGAPKDKKNSIQHIVSQQGTEKKRTLMIGDALYDRDSAMCQQVPFLFVEAYALLNVQAMAEEAMASFYTVASLNGSENVSVIKSMIFKEQHQ